MTPEEINKIAKLARLELSPEESISYSTQLSDIFGYIERLSEVDTSGIAPMLQSISDQGKALRFDTVRHDAELLYFREHYTDIAPQTEGPFYKVPKLSA
ncbi:MAG: Asp-tRNA(Asn)/Glu-tRNA(Gln) amidotransferase subunit GatC [Candidatus Caenarcaniphilales bacterium]|nr:Asp-tRNA(Asn)/Glu-tRNA(Gln) amidotransferase subunit GatC [Candidatus Caenarcaniphilales bacterium]